MLWPLRSFALTRESADYLSILAVELKHYCDTPRSDTAAMSIYARGSAMRESPRPLQCNTHLSAIDTLAFIRRAVSGAPFSIQL